MQLTAMPNTSKNEYKEPFDDEKLFINNIGEIYIELGLLAPKIAVILSSCLWCY